MHDSATVLVIDDDQDMRWAMRQILADTGYDVAVAECGRPGLDIAASKPIDAVLLDMRMPGMGGEEVLDRLKTVDSGLPVIVVTAFGTIPGAIDAIRTGAFEYITKPFRNDLLLDAVKRAVAHRRASRRGSTPDLRSAMTAVMGHGPSIQALVDQIDAVIATDYSVLICGETGTGKEIVAHCLHEKGGRAKRPFSVIDCGALVETLIDAEFFGHEKGAFTGAGDRRHGRLEVAANGGTIFLDEIGNLSMAGQKALLRALEQRVIHRVGGAAPIKLDVRVLAATNEDLGDRAASGEFREDLFFRLSEYVITLPPLRARREDVEFLAGRFLAEARQGLARPPMELDAAALALLRGHHWPGNVRELRNVMRRLALAGSGPITAADVGARLGGRARLTEPVAPPETADGAGLRSRVQDKAREFERGVVIEALRVAGGNKALAARDLGIGYKSFREKLKTFGIGVEDGDVLQ